MTIPLINLINCKEHKDDFKRFFTAMRRAGYTHMAYYFEGSGDSGNMEQDVQEWQGHHEGVHPKDVVFDTPINIKEPNGYTFEPGTSKRVQLYDDKLVVNLEQLGNQVAWLVLNNSDYDWYNNDGGFGWVHFYITDQGVNKIEMDMNIRTVSSEQYPDEVEFPHG